MGDAAHRFAQPSLHRALPFPIALRWSAFGLFVLLAGASLFLAGPQVQVDEGSYLLTAATLAGKLAVNGVNGYYSGYSLLLVPAFLLGSDPDRIYHGALVINALLVATTPFALFRLTSLLHPEVEVKVHFIAAIAATAYAPLLLVSQHAMSESALVPLYAWTLATGAQALFAQSRPHAILCGTAAGLLLLVHPRGAAIAAPVIAIIALFSLTQRGWRWIAAAIVIAAIGVAALHAPLEFFAGKDADLGSSYSAPKVIRRLSDSGAGFWIALNGLGSVTEAIVTSLGIFSVAACMSLVGLYKALSTPRHMITAQTAMTLAILLGAAAAFLMSAVFFVLPTRADQIAYGRYALPAVVPMLAMGLVNLAVPNARRMRVLAWAMAVALACLALMVFASTRLPMHLTRLWSYINAPVLYVAQDLVHLHSPWVSIAFCFLIFGGAFAACAARSARAGIACFGLVNLLIAVCAWAYFVRPQSLIFEGWRHIEEITAAFEASTNSRLCLTITDSLDLWQAIDLRWQIFPEVAASQSTSDDTCTHGTIDRVTGPDGLKAGFQLIGMAPSPTNNALVAGLFIEPGPALEKWKQNHPLPVMASFAPLPELEQNAGIQVRNPDALSRHIRTDVIVGLDVAIKHGGVDARWPPIQYGDYPIRLGVQVTPLDSDRVVGEYRTPLVTELKPGEAGDATIKIGPFSEPGRYRARIGIVQERVAWFAGSEDLEFEVDAP